MISIWAAAPNNHQRTGWTPDLVWQYDLLYRNVARHPSDTAESDNQLSAHARWTEIFALSGRFGNLQTNHRGQGDIQSAEQTSDSETAFRPQVEQLSAKPERQEDIFESDGRKVWRNLQASVTGQTLSYKHLYQTGMLQTVERPVGDGDVQTVKMYW